MQDDKRIARSLIAELDIAVQEMLKEDLPLQLAGIKRALDDKQAQQAVHGVHAIHGSAAFCKLEALRQCAAVLENSLNNNEMNADHIRAFEDNVNIVLDILDNQ